MLVDARSGQRDDLARDVDVGLRSRPPHVPWRYLYDEHGARLFDTLFDVPEYYLGRAERGILGEAAASIVAACPGEVTLIELGSGAARNSRLLLDELYPQGRATRYAPIDLEPGGLVESARRLLHEYPGLTIRAVAGDPLEGLRALVPGSPGPRLVAWLGSGIAALERQEAAMLLRVVREVLSGQDRLVLGVDLRKERGVLERAYDDQGGLWASLNRNLLARLQRELDGEIPIASFRHRACYDDDLGRVDLGLVATTPVDLVLRRIGLQLALAPGDSIRTASAHKYSQAELRALTYAGGFRLLRPWLDGAGAYCVALLAPA